MYKHFISRCRASLHAVLTMSPIGYAFRRRLRMLKGERRDADDHVRMTTFVAHSLANPSPS